VFGYFPNECFITLFAYILVHTSVVMSGFGRHIFPFLSFVELRYVHVEPDRAEIAISKTQTLETA